MSMGKRALYPVVIAGVDPLGKIAKSPSCPSGSMAADVVSDALDIQNVDNVCMEVVWGATGTPIGTLHVEGSVSGQNWKDIGLAITGPAGSAGNVLLDLNQLSFPKVRLRYTRVSGTGTIVVFAGGKGL